MPATVREMSQVSVRVVLPGGLWPDGHRRDDAGGQPVCEIGLRPVGVEDEVFVLDTATGFLPSARATALLARCMLDGDQVASALTVGDREALLLHLRRITIGETVDCILRCPVESCSEQMDLALGVSDLLLPPYQEVRPSYDVHVNSEGERYAIVFRLPTAGDLDSAAALAFHDPEVGASEILRQCVLRAERNGAPLDLLALPESVRSTVASAMAEHDPQAELLLELTCPTCDASFSAVFDTAAFFLRELEDRAGRLLREVHTLALHYHWGEADILRMPSSRRAQYLELVAEALSHEGAQ